MFTLVHTQKFLSLPLCKNNLVGLLVKRCPRPVAATFDSQRNLIARIAQSGIVALGCHIQCGVNSLVATDVLFVLGGDVHHRQRSRRRNGKQTCRAGQQQQ